MPIARAHPAEEEGAVIYLSRTLLPPREPVALENRFTAAEERERSNERHRGR